MQRMRKLQMVLTTLMLLLGLTFFNINNVFAWYNTPVQNKILYCPFGGEPAAKMGTTTQYGFIGPAAERDPQFYSALIAKGGDDQCDPYGWFFFVDTLRIEISGVYPNGDTIPGDNFGDLTVLVSPDDSDVEKEILKMIFDILVDIQPFGLSAVVKNTISPGGAITDHDVEKAWAEWPGGGSVLDCIEKGLRFGYELNVDPALEGTYTINIHYSAVIWQALLPHYFGYVGTLDLYDTITYEYVNTPPAPSTPSGHTYGYRDTSYSYSTSTTDPNGDSLRYQFYWGDDLTTETGWYTSGATASASHSWSSLGTYSVKVRAKDSTETWSDWSPILTVNIVNRAPNRPSLTGPTSGYVGETYTYTARATDPDGDKIKYTFYWRDGTSTTTGYYNSGDYVSRSHSWGSAKTYYVYVKATDYYGAYKSSSLTVTISSVNNPPNTPSKPSGPASGYVGYSYTYSTSTTDPDLDRVRYKFSWGDGLYTDTGYYSSGATVYASHKWSTTGYKDVKVKAYDGKWSGWSPILTVYIHYAAGCPMLYVYDGSEYVEEGLLDIHNPEGVDVVYEHGLASTPERDGAYMMRLTEHPQTHSFIDQVKLYAILEDGTAVKLPLIWAWHSEDDNVLPQLLHSDEWKADTLGADLNEGTSQSIDLKFAALSPNLEIVGFMFQIEGNNAIIK